MYPPLQALDFMSPAYQQQSQLGLSKVGMVEFWLLYVQGHIRNKQYLLQNKHVPRDVLQNYASSTLDKSLLIKRSLFNRTDLQEETMDNYNRSVWEEIKDIFLNPYFAPLVAKDFQGLPKTFVFTGFRDVLCDDGTWYAEALKKANVNVTHYHHETAYHALLWTKRKKFLSIYEHVVQYIKNNF